MGPGAYPPQPAAAEQVRLPAIFLEITGVLGALGAVSSLLYSLFVGANGLIPGDDSIPYLMQGTMGFASAIVGLAVSGLIIYGGLSMKALRAYPLAVATAVVAMIPCLSPCCLLGLPIGIWALAVLLRPEVKAAFRS
jgi:hypothetical protein